MESNILIVKGIPPFLNYTCPVVLGPLEVRGRVVRKGERITFAEAEIWDLEGKLLAKGTQTGVSIG